MNVYQRFEQPGEISILVGKPSCLTSLISGTMTCDVAIAKQFNLSGLR